MKVLSVIDSFGHGGAETVLVEIALGLREHQHHIVHFSGANGIDAHAPFLTALRCRGIEVSDLPWSCFSAPAGWAEVLDGIRPDLVLFHWWGNHPWQRWVDRNAEVPSGRRSAFALVMHHVGIPAPPGYDRYVLVTEAQREQVAQDDAARVRVIPNGVDLRRFRTRRKSRRSSREMVVGRLSSMREGKIAADLVDDLAAFAVPDTRYVLAGDGLLRPTLDRRAAELGLEDQITFPGYVPRARVADTLQGLDVFCYATSTASECHPLVFLEALASGLPIVAEARGGVPGVVQHGVNGLLATSVEEIGEHLHRLRSDDDLRVRLARGARVTARRFSVAEQLEGYRVLLRELEEERAQTTHGPWHE